MANQNDNNLPQYPEAEFKDEFQQWVKSAIGDIIPMGNTLTSVFSSFVSPKNEKRREEFLRDVAYWIMKLSRQNETFKPENLMNDEKFISSIQLVVSISVKTYQKEKLEALRNALLNTIVMKDLDENFKLLFFTYIEDITVIHIDIIKFFRTVRDGFGALDKLYKDHFRLYEKERGTNVVIDELLFTSLCKDLENKGLLLHGKKIKTGGGPRKDAAGQFEWIRHTELGEKFYRFILDPKVKNKFDVI